MRGDDDDEAWALDLLEAPEGKNNTALVLAENAYRAENEKNDEEQNSPAGNPVEFDIHLYILWGHRVCHGRTPCPHPISNCAQAGVTTANVLLSSLPGAPPGCVSEE